MTARIIVQGIVQGVGYRFFAICEAKKHNIKGYVKNLANGNVEVMAQGEKGMLNEFIKILKIGPASAHITGIDVKWFDEDYEFEDFRVKF